MKFILTKSPPKALSAGEKPRQPEGVPVQSAARHNIAPRNPRTTKKQTKPNSVLFACGGVKRQKIEPIICQMFSAFLIVLIYIADAHKNGQFTAQTTALRCRTKTTLPYKSRTRREPSPRVTNMQEITAKYFQTDLDLRMCWLEVRTVFHELEQVHMFDAVAVLQQVIGGEDIFRIILRNVFKRHIFSVRRFPLTENYQLNP